MALMHVKVMFFGCDFEAGFVRLAHLSNAVPIKTVPIKWYLSKHILKSTTNNIQKQSRIISKEILRMHFYDFVLSALYSDAGPSCGIETLNLKGRRGSRERKE